MVALSEYSLGPDVTAIPASDIPTVDALAPMIERSNWMSEGVPAKSLCKYTLTLPVFKEQFQERVDSPAFSHYSCVYYLNLLYI